VNGKSTAPALTRNRAYQDSLSHAPHHVKAFTVGFLDELGCIIDSSTETARSLWKRTLVLSAGRDCFVSPEQIAEWFGHIPAVDKTLREYPEAYHLLWHDWDKEQVATDVREWILRRTPLHA
jgi:alpha-beta hydrolase superfamily lysophospholipase